MVPDVKWRWWRKKPVVVRAYLWSGRPDGIVRPWEGGVGLVPCSHCGVELRKHGLCDTLEGTHIVCPGDWIIEGVKREKYPCKPDIFDRTYEEVDSRRMLPTTPGEIEGIEKKGG